MIRTALPLVLLLAASLSGDDAPYLVRDFPGSLTARSSVTEKPMWITIGNTSWFIADHGDGFGHQVWKTDGTEEGTVQVTPASEVGTASHADDFVGVVNGRLVYDGDFSGGRLFAIDTTSGERHTLMQENSYSQAGFGLGVIYKGELYFRASGIPGNRTGTALGKTDGTPAGTSFLELNSGLLDYSVGSRLSVAGSSILFTGHTQAGWGVFLTDGTMAGTARLVPVRQNTNDVPTFALGDKLLFLANPDPATDSFTKQLWITDGTVEGSRILADKVDQFSATGVFDGRLVFMMKKQEDAHTTWITDGTVAGTQPFDLVDPRWRYFPDQAIGGKFFFLAYDPDTPALYDDALFTTGPVPGTPVRVIGGIDSTFAGHAANGRFYFIVNDAQHGTEWWSSDGTVAGTHIAADIYPGPGGSSSNIALPRPDGLFVFAAGPDGMEPWLVHATGAKLLKNIAPDIPSPSSDPKHLRAGRDLLFYVAADGYDRVVGRSNGSAAGTKIDVVRPFSWSPSRTVVSGNRYYISSNFSGPGYQVLSTDGTDAGTFVLSDAATGDLFPFRDGILFTDRIDGTVRFSDGTVSGTRFFADAQLILAINGRAWFLSGPRIAFTDDTALTYITPAGAQIGTFLSAAAGPANTMYFIDNDSDGYRLWRTDGTTEGTRVVKVFDALPSGLTATTDKLFFAFKDTLWVTDGTEANTVPLPANGNACTGAINFATIGNQLYWYTPSSPGKQTLWQSDGTVGGTVNRLTYSAFITGCAPVASFEGRVYFTAFDTPHGFELWSSDGTTAGTGLIADIFPGSRGSEPRELTAGTGHLFFTADSPGKGRELWAIGDHQLPRRRGVRK